MTTHAVSTIQNVPSLLGEVANEPEEAVANGLHAGSLDAKMGALQEGFSSIPATSCGPKLRQW
jgi:hypothetical protein